MAWKPPEEGGRGRTAGAPALQGHGMLRSGPHKEAQSRGPQVVSNGRWAPGWEGHSPLPDAVTGSSQSAAGVLSTEGACIGSAPGGLGGTNKARLGVRQGVRDRHERPHRPRPNAAQETATQAPRRARPALQATWVYRACAHTQVRSCTNEHSPSTDAQWDVRANGPPRSPCGEAHAQSRAGTERLLHEHQQHPEHSDVSNQRQITTGAQGPAQIRGPGKRLVGLPWGSPRDSRT